MRSVGVGHHDDAHSALLTSARPAPPSRRCGAQPGSATSTAGGLPRQAPDQVTSTASAATSIPSSTDPNAVGAGPKRRRAPASSHSGLRPERTTSRSSSSRKNALRYHHHPFRARREPRRPGCRPVSRQNSSRAGGTGRDISKGVLGRGGRSVVFSSCSKARTRSARLTMPTVLPCRTPMARA